MLTVAIILATLLTWWRMAVHWAFWVGGPNPETVDFAGGAFFGLLTCWAYPAVLAFYGIKRTIGIIDPKLPSRVGSALAAPPGALTEKVKPKTKDEKLRIAEQRRIEAEERRAAAERKSDRLERELGIGKYSAD